MAGTGSRFTLKPPTIQLSEGQIQAQVVQYLGLKRYDVLEIGKSRKGVCCPQCRNFFVPRGWQGNTPGAPDLLISASSFPAGTWLGVEMKAEKGDFRGREEQKSLADKGRILVARSLDDVIKILEREKIV